MHVQLVTSTSQHGWATSRESCECDFLGHTGDAQVRKEQRLEQHLYPSLLLWHCFKHQ